MQTSSRNPQRGIALVVVLVFLVLLSVFIISFFSNSQDELVAAQSFTGEVSAQQLADSAVSVVMGQIREATTRAGGVRADGSNGKGAWGSQPGMIRVYADGAKASGKADAFFKLYSSDDMVISGAEIDSFNPDTEVPSGKTTGWNYLPAMWTNLNEKVNVPPPPGSTEKEAYRYPILDPLVAGLVEGLEFIKSATDDSRELSRMPVKWLYVLKDGTLTAPSLVEANGTRVKWVAGQRAPTLNNPIVGRVAFWTDDETCKININTAGGFSTVVDSKKNPGGMPTTYAVDDYAGSFWDTPRANTQFDRGIVQLDANGLETPLLKKGGLALSQPVRGEFQRYPGHPATTSLGVIFRDPRDPTKGLLSSGQLALLTPRLQYSFEPGTDDDSWPVRRRGSNYGTARVLAKPDPDDPKLVSEPPDMRVKRLYSSVDELFFAQPDPTATTGGRRVQSDQELQLPLANGEPTVLTPLLLDQLRFFLTANSRAPELNLHGRPRMTIWPVFNVVVPGEEEGEMGLWNASDRLLAFCSTVGPTPSKDPTMSEEKVKRFIFQRTPVRNALPSGAASSRIEAEIKRNYLLYDYLRELTDLPFPGFGGQSFKDKYAKQGDKYDRDQILTEMFDYIRVVNLRDSTRDKEIISNGKYTAIQKYRLKEKYKYAPRGLVVPLKFNRGQDTFGFGRFPTISEASLVLYNSGYLGDDGIRYLQGRESRGFVKVPKGGKDVQVKIESVLVRAFLIFETFNPMQGYAPLLTPDGRAYDNKPIVFEVTGLEKFQINGTSLNFKDKAVNEFKTASGSVWGGRNSGGSEGFMHTLYEKRNPKPELINVPRGFPNGLYNPSFGPKPQGTGATYEFQSMPDNGNEPPGVPIPLDTEFVHLSGGELTLTIYLKDDTVKRTIKLDFQDATVPVPTDEVWGDKGKKSQLDIDGYEIDRGELNGPNVFQHTVPGGMIPDNLDLLNSSWTSSVDPRAVKSFNGRLNWVQDGYSENLKHPIIGPPGPNYTGRWRQILQPGDVVRSVVYGPKDVRVSCISDDKTVFQRHPDYGDKTVMHAQTLRRADGGIYYPYYVSKDAPNNTYDETQFGNIAELPIGKAYPRGQAADLPGEPKDPAGPKGINGVRRPDGRLGDFDTGIGNLADGPFCAKADEGNLAWRYELTYFDRATETFKTFDPPRYHYPIPYFTWNYEEAFDTFFTPNRQVPSPVAFGSLLAGRGAHWQTLCFSPNPVGDSHPGRANPKEYLWLDLFTMPVVEPYAISEPFSTAGKINLNYPIVPFPHIKRTTGLRAALQAERVTAFPISDSNPDKKKPNVALMSFKSGDSNGRPHTKNYRLPVDRDETLKAFDAFFAVYNGGPLSAEKDDGSPSNHDKGFFKSAAQICDFYLYPSIGGKTVYNWDKNETAIKQMWALNPLTGDNVREKPYSDLYPRLTTKSNTYCVHVRAQALRQSAPTDAASAAVHYRTWDEKRDRVVGEYRGSSIIERYIDPDDERFDLKNTNRLIAIDVDAKPLEDAYRFRILNTKRFSP